MIDRNKAHAYLLVSDEQQTFISCYNGLKKCYFLMCISRSLKTKIYTLIFYSLLYVVLNLGILFVRNENELKLYNHVYLYQKNVKQTKNTYKDLFAISKLSLISEHLCSM
jgi:hypothetical protein